MGLKIFTIILLLFIAEITFLSTKEPKTLQSSKKDISYATIAFKGVQGYSIDANGISEQLVASEALKYQYHDELYDINTTFHEGNLTHHLTAKQARHENGIFHLRGEVLYENNQSMQIKSEELEYNTHTKMLKSPSAFVLRSRQGDMCGDTFVLNTQKHAMKSKGIHYTLEVDE